MRQQTLTYYAFPEEHWRRIRTNDPLERILHEIRRADARGRRFRGWAICPEPRRGQAAPHRRHSVVDQTIPEHRTAEGPAMRGPEIAAGVRRTLERRIGQWRALTRTGDLVQRLQVAGRELALEMALAKLDKYHLLTLDDISYVSKDQAETSVLFELIGMRYERRSLLITANQPSLPSRPRNATIR
jgi:hypothetical protein